MSSPKKFLTLEKMNAQKHDELRDYSRKGLSMWLLRINIDMMTHNQLINQMYYLLDLFSSVKHTVFKIN